MTIYLLLLWFGTRVVELNTGNAQLPKEAGSGVQADGTILLNYSPTVIHLAQDGKVLRTIGTKGTGPGEFRSIEIAVWDGKQYILFDVTNKSFSFFNAQGQFLNRNTAMVRDLYYVDQKYFAVDIAPFLPGATSDLALMEVSFGSDFKLIEKQRFCQIDDRIRNLQYSFKLHYPCRVGDQLFVLSQVTPTLKVFTGDLKLVKTIDLNLPRFVPFDIVWSKRLPSAEITKDIRMHSTIHKLCAFEDKLAVSYFVPGTPEKRVSMVQFVTTKGQNVGQPLVDYGMFLGAHGNQLFFIKESEGLRCHLIVWDRH